MNYNQVMLNIRTTLTFDTWFAKLRDTRAKMRIQARIDRMQMGNRGDVKPVGQGVSEMRIDHGPGYRVYFVQRGDVLVVLLCGGDKATQRQDVDMAHILAANLDVE
jgi:putative addiction module killer protein